MSDPLVRQATISDSIEIAEMCSLLWPDATVSEHLAEIEELIEAKVCGGLPFTIFVSCDQEGRLIGFLQVDLRSHADGCNPSHPTGYIEGWYVREEYRRQGIGAAMVHAAEDWARDLGCKEMASDTWIDERNSLGAHQALGFEVVDRCIHFRKPL
ncbi:MAG TPA: GNAT family N-acetyltransferase [Edaphobacter sp.]|jgi:aminoglycoside 6'-N-acetyltransferase I